MIDIHSHIINNVDDGSQSIEESLFLINNAVKEGIKEIICTPHFLKYGDYNIKKDEMIKHFNILKQEVLENDINVKLYLGNEIMYDKVNIMNYVEEGLVSTLNNSRYLLFEMSFVKYRSEISEVIYDIITSGYVPILAHPERYTYVQNHPNIVYNLVKKGCLIQVNQDSILGKNGKIAQEIVMLLLKHKLVNFVASDGHNKNRLVTLKESYQYLQDKLDKEYLEDLYSNNGQKVINNKPIIKYSCSKIEKKKYLGGLITKFQ
jgi:protein-tyrosine phosphatase